MTAAAAQLARGDERGHPPERDRDESDQGEEPEDTTDDGGHRHYAPLLERPLCSDGARPAESVDHTSIVALTDGWRERTKAARRLTAPAGLESLALLASLAEGQGHPVGVDGLEGPTCTIGSLQGVTY